MNSSLNTIVTSDAPETTAATPVSVLQQILSSKPILLAWEDRVRSYKYTTYINRHLIFIAIALGGVAILIENYLGFPYKLKGVLLIGAMILMLCFMTIFSGRMHTWAHAKAEAENTLRAEARRPEFEKEMVAWRRQLNKFFIQNTSEIQGFNFALLHLINENWEAVLPHLIDQLKDENSEFFRRIVVYRNELHEAQQAEKNAVHEVNRLQGKQLVECGY